MVGWEGLRAVASSPLGERIEEWGHPLVKGSSWGWGGRAVDGRGAKVGRIRIGLSV